MEPERDAQQCNGGVEHAEHGPDQSSSSGAEHEIDVHLEVCLCSESAADPEQIAEHVRQLVRHRSLTYEDQTIDISAVDDPVLKGHVESIRLCDCETEGLLPLGQHMLFWQVILTVLPDPERPSPRHSVS
jgi:hypothetical protein